MGTNIKLGTMAFRFGLGAILASSITLAVYYYWPSPNVPMVAAYNVAATDLRDTLSERGTIECINVEHGSCEVRGLEATITSIVAEGTEVAVGDLVCKFDDAEVKKMLAEQATAVTQAKSEWEAAVEELKVQKNTDAAAISAASTEVELAELAKRKYIEGDYPAEVEKLNSTIALAEADLNKFRDEENSMRELVKKGYREYEQLEEVRQRRIGQEFSLKEQKLRLANLEKFTKIEQEKTLDSKVTQAEEKFSRAKADAEANVRKGDSKIYAADQTYKAAVARSDELTEVLNNTEIKAARAGKVRYANEEWYDESRRIREGSKVYGGQKIFYIPDTSEMQVKVKIDEALINKVKLGQKATLQIDAFSQVPFSGKVTTIAAMAESNWLEDRNRYEVVLKIDQIPPEVQLMPGMTCNVDLQVATYRNVLAVPSQAIVQVKSDFYAYVKQGGNYLAKKVTVGPANLTHVTVSQGLTAGDWVALDAYARSLIDFEDELGVAATPLEEDEDGNAAPPVETAALDGVG